MNSELLSPVLIFWLYRKENWSWAFSLGTQQENLGILSIMAFCGICWWCWSVTKLCLTLWGPMDCSMPGSSVLCCLLEFAQTHVCWISNAVQPSHPLLPPSSFTFNLSQHQGLFQGVGSSYQVAKILELQLQHQSFQFKVDFQTDWFDLLVVQGTLKSPFNKKQESLFVFLGKNRK